MSLVLLAVLSLPAVTGHHVSAFLLLCLQAVRPLHLQAAHSAAYVDAAVLVNGGDVPLRRPRYMRITTTQQHSMISTKHLTTAAANHNVLRGVLE
jgi:hypothetical protein